MLGLRATLACPGCVLPLVGCATSETRTAVSAADVSAGKYRKRSPVFLESVADGSFGDRVRSNLGSGCYPSSGPVSTLQKGREIEEAVLKYLEKCRNGGHIQRANLWGKRSQRKDKALLVQKSFDAVLYVNVLVNGTERAEDEGASHNGHYITISGETRQIDEYDSKYERSQMALFGTVPRHYK